jgi:hypothetical protein
MAAAGAIGTPIVAEVDEAEAGLVRSGLFIMYAEARPDWRDKCRFDGLRPM